MENLFKNIKLTERYKSLENNNPILLQRFGADPYAMEYDGRIYVYTTNDVFEYGSDGKLIENSYKIIQNLNCISSDDLVNWTDHGTIQVAGPNGASTWQKIPGLLLLHIRLLTGRKNSSYIMQITQVPLVF